MYRMVTEERKEEADMNFGLIGCGRIAVNHIKAVINNNLELIAVCDLLPEAMENLLSRTQCPQMPLRYTDYRQMLDEHPELELVAIATDSGVHAEIALYCIEHGIHVIIEKPMAMSMRDAREIVRRSQEKHVKVTVCHQNRFNIAIQQMRQALEAGRFGKLSHGAVQVRWNRNQGYYDQAPWRGKWASDGGCLFNQCIHGIDLLRWMMGDDVDEVYGVTKRQFHDYIEGEDLGTAVVKFRNGSVGIIEGTVNVYPQNLEETLYLFGETGTVKIGGKSTTNIDVWRFADETEDDQAKCGLVEPTSNVYGNGHTSLYADMIEAIQQNRKPYIDADAGCNAVEMVLAIYQSAATGMPVKLPLGDVAAMDFTGRFDGEKTCMHRLPPLFGGGSAI